MRLNNNQEIMKIFKSVIIILLLAFTAQAQQGTLTGKVVDKKTGELLIGVAVIINGTTTGTISDLDGNYIFKLDAGIYDIAAQYLSYQKKIISGVVVTGGQVTTLNFDMESESQEIKEVVVAAKRQTNTDAAIISIQKRSYVIQDGISGQQLSKVGSNNAAESMRQMTGASIEDGKYMVMRGLGDRYSLTQLNGLNMASTDPYRNSSSLDIIPARMIDNMITLKSFTPDMPGSFSGGLLNVTTRSFPEKFEAAVNVTATYNSETTFKDFRTTEEKSNAQFLGYEGDVRKMPEILLDDSITGKMVQSISKDVKRVDIMYDSISDQKYDANDTLRNIFHQTANAFNQHYTSRIKTAPVGYNFSASIGNRYKLFKRDLGVFASLSHIREFQNYNNSIVNSYQNRNGQTDLYAVQNLTENRSNETGNLGGLLNLAYKLNNFNTVTFNLLYNNDGEIVSREQTGKYRGTASSDDYNFHVNAQEFTRRQTITPQLFTKHIIPVAKNAEIQTAFSYTNSMQREPNLRYMAYSSIVEPKDIYDENGDYVNTISDTVYTIRNAEYSNPYQFFRNLQDKQYQAKVDYTQPFGKNGKHQIKAGYYFTGVDRSFEEYRFQWLSNNAPNSISLDSYDGNVDSLFNPANFGIIDTVFRADTVNRYTTGYYYMKDFRDRNFYTGSQRVHAGYIMGIIEAADWLKMVGGLRVEATNLKAVSRDISLQEGNITQVDYLPSLGLIFALNEKMNIRLSGAKTLARPNLRELAPFEQFDTKNGFYLIGNPDLKQTDIWNADARWEWFPNAGELIAVSVYYKKFFNPIVKQYNVTSLPELRFINIDEAFVLGTELELRKRLDFMWHKLKDFTFGGNISYIYSRGDIPQKEIDDSKNHDPQYNTTTRPFQGQPPYIINLILGYDSEKLGLEVTGYFNVSGKVLYNISNLATPDIYEQPRPTLNFKVVKSIGKYFNVSLLARNLLNPDYARTQQFRGQTFYAERYKIGRSFQVGLGFKF
jgi:TonB-dependent receptor